MIRRFMVRLAIWLIWNVPLGRMAPYVMGIAMGGMPKKKEDKP